MVVPQGNSATIGKTDNGIFQSLQHHKWRTARFRFATRLRRILSTVIQGLKGLMKASRVQNKRINTGSEAEYSLEPTYVRPTICRPTGSRFESHRKGNGKSKRFT